MRVAVCVLLLMLSLYQGEALKCKFCMSKGSRLCTPTRTQTCSGTANACGAVMLRGPLNHSFRQCVNMAVCRGFTTTPGAFAQCCRTDLCN